MMDMKATNVTLVVKNFLNCKTWRDTYTQFMMDTKITNVNIVVNHFLWKEI